MTVIDLWNAPTSVTIDHEWPCRVCGGRRLFDEISVAYRLALHQPPEWVIARQGGPQLFFVQYCNDRPACIAAAHMPGPEWGDAAPAPGSGQQQETQ